MKHMKYLILGVLILTLATTCTSNIILIGGIQTERTQFCVGEELTLLCQNNSMSYEWVYPGGMISVTPGFIVRNANGFTATYVNSTTTTLQFVVSSDMNGTTLTCVNSILAVNISATYIELLDMSSMTCPGDISAVGIDNCISVDVSLRGVSRCTRECSASISGEAEIIHYVLNEANHDADFFAIGSFNLTNSNLDTCSKYNVNVNVTFFDNSRIACDSVAVELPTNPSSASTTMQQSVSTTVPPSSTSLPVWTIITIVVVIVVCPLVLLTVIIMILCLAKKCKKWSRHVKPQQENLIKANQNSEVILSEESPSGDVYAEVEKKNKGSKKTGKSGNIEKIFMNSKVNKGEDSNERNTQEGVINKDSQEIPHEESPSGAIYAQVEKKNKGFKNSGKGGKSEEISMNAKGKNDEVSKKGNKQERDSQKIPHEKSPSGAVYAQVEKKDKGSKNSGKGGRSNDISMNAKGKNGEDSKKGNTQEKLVCTKADVHITSKSSPPS